MIDNNNVHPDDNDNILKNNVPENTSTKNTPSFVSSPTTEDIPFILEQLLISQRKLCETNQKMCEMMEEQVEKENSREIKEHKEAIEKQKKEERIKIGRGDESISGGDIKTKSYRDYYDRHHTIVTANASDPNDFDSAVYTTNADQVDQIYITLGRNAEKIYVSNDGTDTISDTLFVIISHRGKANFSKEEPIYPGEVKEFYNVAEMRFRSPTAGVTYRVTEYKIDTSGHLTCSQDAVGICYGGSRIDPRNIRALTCATDAITTCPSANKSSFTAQSVSLGIAAVQLPSITVPSGYAVVFTSIGTNDATSKIYIADSAANTAVVTSRNTLVPGDVIRLFITNSNLVWAVANAPTQYLDIIVEQ